MLLLVLLVAAIHVQANSMPEVVVPKVSLANAMKLPSNQNDLSCDFGEHFETGSICERTCVEPSKLTCYNKSGCRCAAGLYRCYSGLCAKYEYCDNLHNKAALVCGTNEMYVTANSIPSISNIPRCEPTCQNRRRWNCPDAVYEILPQCRCKPGYLRDLNVCVRKEQCGMRQ